MYYRGRYYGTAAHRFLSENPSGFGGGDMNLYVCWEQPDELHGAAPRLRLQVPAELLAHDLSLSWDRYSASSTRRLCVRASGSKLFGILARMRPCLSMRYVGAPCSISRGVAVVTSRIGLPDTSTPCAGIW
jgi:hypothetical protein